ALEVARLNADQYQTDAIQFMHCDVLHEELPVGDLDVIVSNPPYVRESEKAYMHTNVIDHEPHLALFVPEDDPLVFYRVIAAKGMSSLKAGGKLYFEINEALGTEVIALLTSLGYTDIVLRRDLNDRDRMVRAVRGN